jgi:sterol desaturase/sphingolipid hydroxylase (fatty acid hydroxylase superfamily)
MFFFWDILFGTAKITRQFPASYGVEGMRKAEWPEQLFWPLAITPKANKTTSKSVDTTKSVDTK